MLNVAKHNLTQAEALLAESLTKSYKSSGQDVVSYLLASHSFSELVDNMQVMQRSNSSNSDLIAQIAATKKVIAKRTADLAKETAHLKHDQADQLAVKQQVEAGLQSLQARKAHISADIQRLIDAQQRGPRRRRGGRRGALASAASSTGSTNIPVPPSSTLGGQAVAIAMQYLGTPYVWGGASPVGLRLLRPHDVRLRPARRLAAAQRGRPVRHGHPGAGAPWSPAIWSSSTGSATSACTSAAARSSTRRTPATWSRSARWPTTSRPTSAPAATADRP